jgi:hypothetical protein
MQGIWTRLAKTPHVGPGWPRVDQNVLVELGSSDDKAAIRAIGFESIDRDCVRQLQLAGKMGLAW